jgi:hypothetical protein
VALMGKNPFNLGEGLRLLAAQGKKIGLERVSITDYSGMQTGFVYQAVK